MNRAQILQAIGSGTPFTIRMADGKEFEVRHREFISVAPRGAFVIVWDPESEEGEFDVLPMLTMTGIHRRDSSLMREEPEED